MTICLAALCSDGTDPHAVLAADRMVTMGGFIEFEHAVPKISHVSGSAVIMVAGDTLVGTRMAQDVCGSLAGTTPRALDIARLLAAKYQEVRAQEMESQFLIPRGLSLQTFYGGHASFNPQMTMVVDQTMMQFNLGVELLLAGVDDHGAHILTVHNPGPTEKQHDVIGYAAVGSGAIHAIQSMIGFGHSASADLGETIFRVYASKRRAEAAPGVGQDTDMAVLSAKGARWLTESELKELADLFDNYRTAEPGHAELGNLVADLKPGRENQTQGGGADGQAGGGPAGA